MMKKSLFLMMMFTVIGALSCKGDGGGEAVEEIACNKNSDCDAGKVCEDGMCVDYTKPDCAADEFWDYQNLECTSVTKKCSGGNCSCSIMNGTGQLTASGTGLIAMPEGTSAPVEAALATNDGTLLSDVSFTVTVDGSNFTVAGNIITAAGGAGDSALTVKFKDDVATCTTNLKNLGAAEAGKVKVHVFNEMTMAPVSGAYVVLNQDVSGKATTDTDGIASLSASDKYTLSVIHKDHNYMSIVGITPDAGGDFLAVPLSQRVAKEDMPAAGFSGEINYSEYVSKYLKKEQALKAALVAPSIPLEAVANFDLEAIIGELGDAADCPDVNNGGTEADCTGISGCYYINISDAFKTCIPLPGGVYLDLLGTPVKSSFDSIASPGNRVAWSLATQLGLQEVLAIATPLLNLFSGECACNKDVGTKKAGDFCNDSNGGEWSQGSDICTCDVSCPGAIPIEDLVPSVVQILSKLGSGLTANINAKEAGYADWQAFASEELNARDAGGMFEILSDSLFDGDNPQAGVKPSLKVTEGWTNFTNVKVPKLPADFGKDGQNMEAMVALTGVQVMGQGFIPLGVGLGLDCMGGEGQDCYDQITNANGSFDQQINGFQVCDYDSNPDKNNCPESVTTSLGASSEGKTSDGSIGLYYTNPFAGLEGSKQEQVTLLVSLPLSAFFQDTANLRASAVLKKGALSADGTFDQSSVVFPSTAGSASSYNPSSGYTPAASKDIHWVTFAVDTASTEAGTQSKRWNVYTHGTEKFLAPNLKELGGSFGGENSPTEPKIGDNKVNITHIGLDMEAGVTVDSLVRHNGTTLNRTFTHMTGLAISSKNYKVAQ
ncbi:MAG: hypothetical protein VYA34_09960 [Myxococcota bacterium]|nr:hypothetical protein [Myxococcota bacterium]